VTAILFLSIVTLIQRTKQCPLVYGTYHSS